MNLVIIAAVIAVAGAAKLDRTYLPPASAKTAGGNSESLQTPFAANSLNQGHGGFPKGSFANDFQGVVVDAASPGTRASGEGETGLGAPRISYGSTNSRVGDAAFRGSLAGFRQTPGNSQFTRTNQAADVQTAGTVETPQGFSQKPSDFQGFGQGSQELQGGSSQGHHNPQGFPQGPRDSQGQVSHGSQSVKGSLGSQGSDTNYQRSQTLSARDRDASILRFDNNVGTDSFSYSFETDNGISAEETGTATNGVQAQGGYSYTGDDGQVYSVTYTADEGGYQPKGDHLPTPPPIPVEILKSLEQNAREEAAGQVDDGSYDAQKYNAEGDYTENVSANGEHNGRPPTTFVNRPESDATASGTFINQSNQPFVRPSANALPGQREETNTGSNAQGINVFGSSQNPNNFDQFQNNAALTNTQENNLFGSSSNSNNFGQSNETPLGPQKEGHQQLGPESFNNQNVEIDDITTQGHDVRPNSNPFGNSNSFNQLGTSSTKPGDNNSFGSVATNANNFGQRDQSSRPGFGSKNEYLPPVNNFDHNRRPASLSDQRPGSSMTITSLQDSNKFSQSFSNLLPASEQEVDIKSQGSTSPSGFVTGSQSHAQFGSHQNNKFSNAFEPTRVSSTQNVAQTQTDSKPEFSGTGNQNTDFAQLQSQKATSQPLTELTTPFETSPNSQQNNAQTSTNAVVFGAQSSQTLPTQPSFENEPHAIGMHIFPAPTSASASTFSSSSATINAQRPNSRPFNTNNAQSSLFSDQRPQSQRYNPDNSFTQPQSQTGFPQNEGIDMQFASSTQRPTFGQNIQQVQGHDNSYYYNQPSKTFNTPNTQFQNSRFPSSSSSSNQFNRISQQSPFATQSSAQVSDSKENLPVSSFISQNRPTHGPTRQSIQPAFPSPIPTSASQGSTISGFNGITQATASSFTSGAPTAATHFGSQNSFSGFGRRPIQQPNNQFGQQVVSQSSSLASQPSFTQQTTAIPQSFPDINRNRGQQNSFQNQQTGIAHQSTFNQPDSTRDELSTIPNQQYGGEIYEYKKPAQTLPAPDQKETSTGVRQFGDKQSSDRFGQSQDSQSSTTYQTESQSELPKKPQFGSQPPRSQFGQQNQLNAQNTLSSSRPQFGIQSTTRFGNAQPTQPSFAQTFDSQKTQHNGQLNVQGTTDESQNTTPQFGQRPFGNNQQNPNQSNQAASKQRRPQSDQNRPRPPCCKPLPNAPDVTQGSSQDISGFNQGQFGVQDSGFSSQGFKPNQSSTQSFAGKGEVFGGPRKPPSFDVQTGYHY